MAHDAFLILHGLENHRPEGHWQFWLASRLREREAQVLYPGLSDPDAPRYAIWRDEVKGCLEALEGEHRVVVCHSLACVLWFRAAADLAIAGPVDRLLLVAPPASASLPEVAAGFRIDTLEVAAIRASVSGDLRIVCSDADPYNPTGAQTIYGNALDVRVDVLPGAGHITPEDGYGPWPAVEAWCLGSDAELAAE